MFGAKSVRLLPGYRPPDWLDADGVAGAVTELAPRGRGLRAHVAGPRLEPGRPGRDAGAGRPRRAGVRQPLLAHPLQRRQDRRRRGAAAPRRARRARAPRRVVLGAPPSTPARSPPTCSRRSTRRGAGARLGASLGGLAMLHAHRLAPFNGLFLQSACFFVPRHDAHEARFPRYRRIVRVVRRAAARRRRAGASDADLRRGRGEHRQQPRDGARAGRAGLRRRAARGRRHAQLHRLARRLRPAPDPAARRWMRPPAESPPSAAGSRLRPLRAARARVPGRGRQRLGLGEPGHGRTRSARCSRPAGCELYCVDAIDGATWSDRSLPLEERARRHAGYETWVLDEVVPHIHRELGGAQEILTCGASLGAFHAINFALRRADVFPLAHRPVGQLRPVGLGRLGRARRRRLLQQPDGLRAAPRRRPPRLAARAR